MNNSLCSVSHAIACGQVSLYVYDVCIHEFEDDLSSARGNVTISSRNYTVKIKLLCHSYISCDALLLSSCAKRKSKKFQCRVLSLVWGFLGLCSRRDHCRERQTALLTNLYQQIVVHSHMFLHCK